MNQHKNQHNDVKNPDIIYTALAAKGQLRASAVSARALVEYAKNMHGLSPVATVALGRLLCAGSLMSCELKGKSDKLTLTVKGDGPLGSLTVCADSKNHVKGYCGNPLVFSQDSSVSAAVGKGLLRVTKDLGLKQPFTGQTELVSGEIASDLTYYFAVSEQTPSVAALGVLLDFDENSLLALASSQEISSSALITDCYRVSQAGGYIIQAMPGAADDTLNALDAHIKNTAPISAMLSDGLAPGDILKRVLAPFDVTITAQYPTAFDCGCSQESMRDVLLFIRKEELEASADFPLEIVCPYCSKKYIFEDL